MLRAGNFFAIEREQPVARAQARQPRRTGHIAQIGIANHNQSLGCDGHAHGLPAGYHINVFCLRCRPQQRNGQNQEEWKKKSPLVHAIIPLLELARLAPLLISFPKRRHGMLANSRRIVPAACESNDLRQMEKTAKFFRPAFLHKFLTARALVRLPRRIYTIIR